jgi:Flp pilus assembly protein TadD
VIAAIEPTPAPSIPAARGAPPPARTKAVPAAPAPAKAKAVPATPPPAKAKAVPATIAHVAAAPRAAAPVEDRRATGRQGGKRNQRHTARARKVAIKAPAAKRTAPTTTTATPERGDPRPHYERGNALLFAGDSKGAIAAYREAIRAAPADASAFRGLGLAYEQQSEPVFAARALRRYLKLAPNAPDHEIVARRLERLSHAPKRK